MLRLIFHHALSFFRPCRRDLFFGTAANYFLVTPRFFPTMLRPTCVYAVTSFFTMPWSISQSYRIFLTIQWIIFQSSHNFSFEYAKTYFQPRRHFSSLRHLNFFISCFNFLDQVAIFFLASRDLFLDHNAFCFFFLTCRGFFWPCYDLFFTMHPVFFRPCSKT